MCEFLHTLTQVIKVPAEVTKKIICDNAAKLYRIELT